VHDLLTVTCIICASASVNATPAPSSYHGS
jgi:hypothetical protein